EIVLEEEQEPGAIGHRFLEDPERGVLLPLLGPLRLGPVDDDGDLPLPVGRAQPRERLCANGVARIAAEHVGPNRRGVHAVHLDLRHRHSRFEAVSSPGARVATTIGTAAMPAERRRSRLLRRIAGWLEQLASRGDNGQAARPTGVRRQTFCPYRPQGAIASVIVLWIALGGLAFLFHRYVGWPARSSQNHVFYVATVIGLLPVALVVLDAVARSGGAVDLRGFKIDFSRSVVQNELQLAPNLGQLG